MKRYRLDLAIAKTALGNMQRVVNENATKQRVFDTLEEVEVALVDLFEHRLSRGVLVIDRPLVEDAPHWFDYNVYCVGRQNTGREIMAHVRPFMDYTAKAVEGGESNV